MFWRCWFKDRHWAHGATPAESSGNERTPGDRHGVSASTSRPGCGDHSYERSVSNTMATWPPWKDVAKQKLNGQETP